jgi:hypothetical protein
MIEKFCVFGERCSGTTYLENLIESNFGLPMTDEFGLKHFWNMTDFSNNNTTLFIGIERELLSWLDSFAKTPHQVHPYRPYDYEALFFKPIRSYYQGDMVEDYENIIECRRTKSNIIRSLFPNLLKHYFFITYEELVANPIEFLHTIQTRFQLQPILNPFQNWITYKDEKELFVKKPLVIPENIIERLKNTYPIYFSKEVEN